jgi:hypothetical protein
MSSTEEVTKMINDLKIFIEKPNFKKINGTDLDSLISELSSEYVKNYLNSFTHKSQPESTLREFFFSPTSPLGKYIFENTYPESSGSREEGSIDYIAQAKDTEIKLELKPLYEGHFTESSAGRDLNYLHKKELKPEDHKEQIRKYLLRPGEFVVLTNLEDWYFYSKTFSLDEDCKYFIHKKFSEVITEFKEEKDFWFYVERLSSLVKKEDLDIKFHRSLKTWVNRLNDIEFKVEYQERKTQEIIFLLNKLIFIQTLENIWAIPLGFLEMEWNRSKSRWDPKANKKLFLEEFISSGLDRFFYFYYDTELFKDIDRGDSSSIVDYIKEEDSQYTLFYKNLEKVLGIKYKVSGGGWTRGVIQYNFRNINEDVLGKAYESFLAEIREEQGIYYTPRYITKYITENVLIEKVDSLINDFTNTLNSQNYETCKEILKKLFSLKIVDLACGSGSFLIKILSYIWEGYKKVYKLIEDKYNSIKESFVTTTSEGKEYLDYSRSPSEYNKLLELKKLIEMQKRKDKRILIAKMLLRHIHGTDLDEKALQVAKLNLWLHAIKLEPKAFQYWRLRNDNHILPNLEINLCHGNALVSPNFEESLEILNKNHKDDIKDLFSLRKEYMDDIKNIKKIDKINRIKQKLIEELNKNYKFQKEDGTEIEIFYWVLTFWYLFFNPDGTLKETENRGFDVIISNPPYVSWKDISNYRIVFESGEYNGWSFECRPNHNDAQPNLYIFFIMRGIDLLKKTGTLSFILPQEWLFHNKTLTFRNQLIEKSKDLYLLKFDPDFKVFKTLEVVDDEISSRTVGTNSLILKLEKGKNNNFYEINIDHTDSDKVKAFLKNFGLKEVFEKDIEEFSIDKKILEKNKFIGKRWETYSSLMYDLIEKTDSEVFITLNDNTEFNVFGGFQPNISESLKYVIEEPILSHLSESEREKCYRCIYEASDLGRYFLKKSSKFWIILNDLYKNENDFLNEAPNLYEILYERFNQESKEKEKWWEFPNPRNLDFFKNFDLKLLSPRTSEDNSFSLDKEKHIFKGTNSAIISHNISIYYLLGVLNSKLADYWYQEYGFQYHGGKTKRYEPGKIQKYMIPILNASEQDTEVIANLVKEIIFYKELFCEFRLLWSRYITEQGTDSKGLSKILINDKDGESDKAWTTDASVYPDAQNPKLDEEYENLIVSCEDNESLKILGIKDDLKTDLILKLRFKDSNLKKIVFLELLRHFDSKKVFTTLRHIFEKVSISVKKPNIWESTPLLLKRVESKFELWLKDNGISDVETDIIEFYNLIKKIDNNIDAFVFYLYSINTEQIRKILDSLKIPALSKNQILREYNTIK